MRRTGIDEQIDTCRRVDHPANVCHWTVAEGTLRVQIPAIQTSTTQMHVVHVFLGFRGAKSNHPPA